ncbi:GntR family transcriptional regulator [Xanthobacteraceae bacterium A53D]
MDQVAETPKLNVEPLGASSSLRALAYDALKRAITEMDIYGSSSDFRLDERQLSEDLGVSRTPIREAMTVLEQEGFVRSVPRRGIFVVRKTKRQLVEMITVWAALESMAARLAATRSSATDLKGLRRLFNEFQEEPPAAHMHEYNKANIAFHQAVIRMGGSALIVDMTENLFLHMRAIRVVSIRQDNRSEISMQEHMAIIDALEARDPERAERLVREHTMGLAALVEKHGQFPE